MLPLVLSLSTSMLCVSSVSLSSRFAYLMQSSLVVQQGVTLLTNAASAEGYASHLTAHQHSSVLLRPYSLSLVSPLRLPHVARKTQTTQATMSLLQCGRPLGETLRRPRDVPLKLVRVASVQTRNAGKATVSTRFD
jgi:hypothetical protein